MSLTPKIINYNHMTEEQKDIIKSFIEDHWTFFEQHVQEQLEQDGRDSESADDLALQAIEDLEAA